MQNKVNGIDNAIPMQMHRLVKTDKISTIMFNAETVQEVLCGGLAGSKSSVHTSVTSQSTVLSSELESRAFVVLESVHQQVRIVTNLVGGVGAISSQWVLGPVRGLNVDETRERLVWLSAEKLEEGFEKLVDFLLVGHGLNALSQRLGDLDTKLLSSGHDPEIDGNSGIVQDGILFVRAARAR